MPIARTHRLVLASLPLAAGLSLPTWAQSMSEKAVEAEIDFARGLARDWAFVDMAQTVLDDVSQAKLSDRMSADLALVRCDIYGIGAKASTDPERRNDLFEQAITAYDEYIQANPYAENRTEAEESLIDLSSVYARSLDISLEDAVGEEATALRERKVAVLEKAIARCESLIEEIASIDPQTPATQTRRNVMMLQKGALYGKISSAMTDDSFFSEQAIETYSELIFDVGEGTEIALRANAGIGDVLASTGQYEDAREFYLGVISSVIPVDPDEREEMLGWSELPLDIKQKRFLYVELAVPGVQTTSRNLGELELAIESGLYFYNLYRQEGFSLSVLGNDAMLEFASTLVDAGGFIGGDLGAGEAQWFATEDEMKEAVRARRLQRTAIEFALDLAKQIADDNPGTEAARKGGELIATINERPGVEIPPAQLLQAADAKRAGESYEEALAGYRELLTRLDALEPADRVEFGAKTYYGIGLTLRRQGRQLEAAMAFREAIVNWQDPEFNRNNARGYQATIKAWAREAEATEDREIAKLIKQAEDFVIEYDKEGSPDEIIFNRAEKARESGDYEEAITIYESIDEDAAFKDLAIIQVGYCKLRLNDARGARETFENFLTVRVNDPKFEPNDPVRVANRKQSLSRAEFYRAYIDHLVANNRFKKSDGEDASGYQKVIDELKDFATRYGDAGSLVPQSLAMLADSYAKSDQAAKAAEVVDQMVQDYPDDRRTAAAAIDLYKVLDERRDRLQAAATPDPQAITRVSREMAEALKVANGIEAQPDYVKLRNESKLWLDLGEWAEAKRPLDRIVKRFSGDAERGESVTKQVIPDLAEAMVELGEVQEAKDLLAPLVVGDDAPLKFRRPTMLLGRAMLGSVTGDSTRVTRTQGAGGTEEEFTFITGRFDAYANSGDKWTCEWYEAKFMSIYAYYVWGQQDDRKLATAKRVLDDLVNLLEGDLQFTLVDEACELDDVDPALRRQLGDGVLSARYRWLHQKTR